ncbi:hypothetical protein PAPYR_6645 [Paratrimastix pyriformis]|uniref:Uncharacterized protein n=1 Tax=Paratrimastix pyriformis TaxID=342808 RepID=A0ABQ8UF13_9EUKA|nr:hypothetical protein PAPYR_6645 [Paratrimastix pyriformis]
MGSNGYQGYGGSGMFGGVNNNRAQTGWNNAQSMGAANKYGYAGQGLTQQQLAQLAAMAGQSHCESAYKSTVKNEYFNHQIRDHEEAGSISTGNAYINSNAAQSEQAAAAANNVAGDRSAQNVAQNAGLVRNEQERAAAAQMAYGNVPVAGPAPVYPGTFASPYGVGAGGMRYRGGYCPPF